MRERRFRDDEEQADSEGSFMPAAFDVDADFPAAVAAAPAAAAAAAAFGGRPIWLCFSKRQG